MAEDETRYEGHAVGEIETHDCEVEDRVDGDGVHEHEEAFSERADGDESDSAGRSFVCRKDAEEAGAWETVIWRTLVFHSCLEEEVFRWEGLKRTSGKSKSLSRSSNHQNRAVANTREPQEYQDSNSAFSSQAIQHNLRQRLSQGCGNDADNVWSHTESNGDDDSPSGNQTSNQGADHSKWNRSSGVAGLFSNCCR